MPFTQQAFRLQLSKRTCPRKATSSSNMQPELYPWAPVKLLHSCGMHLHTNLIAHVLTYAACPSKLLMSRRLAGLGEAYS